MRFDTVDSPGRVLPFCGSTPSLTSSTSALTAKLVLVGKLPGVANTKLMAGLAPPVLRAKLACWRGGIVTRPRAHLHAGPRDLYFNLVVADRVGASGPVADGILSVQLAADLINGLFNRAVAEGGQVRSSCRGGSDF